MNAAWECGEFHVECGACMRGVIMYVSICKDGCGI